MAIYRSIVMVMVVNESRVCRVEIHTLDQWVQVWSHLNKKKSLGVRHRGWCVSNRMVEEHNTCLTFPSRCSCSVLTVSLSLVSCSWVALRSCWSLVAAWPRSLDSFFSFSRRSCNNSTLLIHTEQKEIHNMEIRKVRLFYFRIPFFNLLFCIAFV